MMKPIINLSSIHIHIAFFALFFSSCNFRPNTELEKKVFNQYKKGNLNRSNYEHWKEPDFVVVDFQKQISLSLNFELDSQHVNDTVYYTLTWPGKDWSKYIKNVHLILSTNNTPTLKTDLKIHKPGPSVVYYDRLKYYTTRFTILNRNHSNGTIQITTVEPFDGGTSYYTYQIDLDKYFNDKEMVVKSKCLESQDMDYEYICANSYKTKMSYYPLRKAYAYLISGSEEYQVLKVERMKEMIFLFPQVYDLRIIEKHKISKRSLTAIESTIKEFVDLASESDCYDGLNEATFMYAGTFASTCGDRDYTKIIDQLLQSAINGTN